MDPSPSTPQQGTRLGPRVNENPCSGPGGVSLRGEWGGEALFVSLAGCAWGSRGGPKSSVIPRTTNGRFTLLHYIF